jgi:serine/threonine protein kinase
MNQPVPELAAGTLLAGRYRIEHLLGRGGMGAVYEATHVELGRRVALKVLRSEVSSDREMVGRFMQEARIAAAIGHTGIVDVFDLGVADSGVYLAMEKLQGIELADRIEAPETLSEVECTSIAMDVASAIEAAHEHGVIHRDLKPANVFLSRPRGATRDVVKVLDFGVAKLTRAEGENLTQTGSIYGTPAYMPPEQLRGAKDIDGRADVYALGCILYEMLTRRRPFDAESLPELVLKIVSELPRGVRAIRPELTPEIDAIVTRAMAPRREERFPSMAALRAALAAHKILLDARPPPSPQSRAELANDATLAGASTGPLTPSNLALPSITGAGSAPKVEPTPTPKPEPAPAVEAAPSTGRLGTITRPPEVSVTPALDSDTARATSFAAPVPARSNAPWIVAGVALTALIALGGYVFSTSSSTPMPTPAASDAPAEAASPEAASPEAVAPPEPTPSREPTPAAHTVAFTSDPLGVQIVLGEDTCTAPCTFGVARTVTEIIARYPERPDVHIPITWPPPAAMHVLVPGDEPERTGGSGHRTGPRTPHAPTPTIGSSPPPPLLPR